MAGNAQRTPRRSLRSSSLPALLLLLPVAVVPRVAVFSHHHHGGGLLHVHLDAAGARAPDHVRHEQRPHHPHPHPHSHPHPHRHEQEDDRRAAGGPIEWQRQRGAPALLAADASAPHWHSQDPFLAALPAAPPAEVAGAAPRLAAAPPGAFAPRRCADRAAARGPPHTHFRPASPVS